MGYSEGFLMPGWALQLSLAFIPIISKLIDKFLPEKHMPTFKKINNIGSNWTIEQIAKMERKRQEKLKEV